MSLSHIKDKIWLPDSYFMNAKIDQTENWSDTLLWLYPNNGSVVSSNRQSLAFDCSMDLQRFPMDTQVCSIEISLFGTDAEQVQLHWWNQSSAVTFDDLHLNDFQWPKVKLGMKECKYAVTGRFSCLKLTMTFKRNMAFYLINSFIPTCFIVFLAWVSFFIDYRSAPARVSLCLLCFLSIMTSTTSNSANSPAVSYIKSIDIYLFFGMALVTSALVEYALISHLLFKREYAFGVHHGKHKSEKCRAQRRIEMIELMSKIIYPVAFILFNLIYWMVMAKTM